MMRDLWRHLVVALSLLVAASSIAVAETRALIVGITDYERANDLPGARTDARNMARFLSAAGLVQAERLLVLTDREATKARILGELARLAKATAEEDHLFFHYSGHGSHLPDKNGDEADGEDEAIVDPAGQMVLDDELNAALSGARGMVTVLLDSCHSGTATRGLVAVPDEQSELRRRLYDGPNFEAEPISRGQMLARLDETDHLDLDPRSLKPGSGAASTAGARRLVWTAASPNEPAWDGGPSGGIFTNALIEGLERRAADADQNGTVTNKELEVFLRQRSAAFCRQSTADCRRRNRDPATCCRTLNPSLEVMPEGSEAWLRAPALGQAPPAAANANADPTPTPDPVGASDTVGSAGADLDNGTAEIVRVTVTPAVARLGQTSRVEIRSNQAGWLYVLDNSADGKLVKIFPNPHSRERRIAPGQRIILPDADDPFAFTASEPTGRGRMIALVAEDPGLVSALLDDLAAFEVIADARALVDKLAFAATRLRPNPSTMTREAVPIFIGSAAYEIRR